MQAASLSKVPVSCLPQVSVDDQRMMQDIQRFYNTMIEELPSNVADLI